MYIDCITCKIADALPLHVSHIVVTVERAALMFNQRHQFIKHVLK